MSYCNCCVEELCMQLYGNHKHGQNCYLTPKQRFSSTMVSPLLKPNEVSGLKTCSRNDIIRLGDSSCILILYIFILGSGS